MGNNINNHNTHMMTTNDLAMTGFSRSTWSPNAITDDLQVYGGGRPNMAFIKDELISIGGRVGKFSGSVKFDDDDLVDDLGRCMTIKCSKKKRDDEIKRQKASAVAAAQAHATVLATKDRQIAAEKETQRKLLLAQTKVTDDATKLAMQTIGQVATGTRRDDDDDLVDELISVGGRIGKFSGSVKFDDDDLVDDLKAGDRIKSAAKKVGSGIKTAAKKVGSGIKNVAGKVHKSAMKNGGYSGSVSAGGIKGKVGYGNKLDDDDDDDDLADDLALFTAIKEKRQAAKAKRAAKKAAM